MWQQNGSTRVTYNEQRATGGIFTFITAGKGVVYASGSSFRKGDDLYTNILINGVICARDRGTEATVTSTHNYHASASCMLPIDAGVHTVQITERVIASHVTVVEF